MTTDTPRGTHTAGPWLRESRENIAGETWVDIAAPGHGLIALNVSHANARLIAAAPALLAAAVAANMWISENDDPYGDAGCPVCGIHSDRPEACAEADELSACALIRAAIDTATGGQS